MKSRAARSDQLSLAPQAPCRFCRIYALAIASFAGAFGAATALQLMLAAGAGLRSYATQLVFYDGIRSTAPMASGTALLLALTLAVHPLDASRFEQERDRILRRAAIAALPGYVAAMLVTIAAGLAVLVAGFGQSSSIVGFGWSIVTWRDFWTGARGVATDTLLILFLARRYALRLQGLGLPEKLIVIVTVTVGLRATLALVLSWLFS